MPNPSKDDTYSPVKAYSPFEAARKAVRGAYNATVGAFGQLGNLLGQTPEVKAAQQQLANIPVGGTPSPYQNYHQVTENDKSLSDVAARYNLPLNQLAEVNKSKTLPPKGSYIQLPRPGFAAQGQVPGFGEPDYFQRIRDEYLNGVYGAGQTTASGRGGEEVHRLTVQANQIIQQIASGQYPAAIPSAVVGFIRDDNGDPLTIQDLIAEGYVMNKEGVLVRGGAGAVNTLGGKLPGPSAEYMNTKAYGLGLTAEGNLNMNALRYDPSTKKFVSIGRLIAQGKLNLKTGRFNKRGNRQYRRKRQNRGAGGGRGGGGGPSTVETNLPVQPTTTEGPQTILDLHLGSG